MTREYCIKVARLKGFDFETARELTTFIKPRCRFDGIVKAWRECLGESLRGRRLRAVRVLVYDRNVRMRTPAVQTVPRMPPQQQRGISRGDDFQHVQELCRTV